MTSLRLSKVRRDFPALDEHRPGGAFVYLDTAATSLKPRVVAESVARALALEAPAAHGGHPLGERALAAREEARSAVAAFLHASPDEIVFTGGATSGLNLVASGWAQRRVGPGDRIVVTDLEHHANLLPWRRVAAASGATLVVVPLAREAARDDGSARVARIVDAIDKRTKVVALTQVSNVLGASLDVAAVARAARRVSAVTIVDGAQALAHSTIDVRALGCDAWVASAHKAYGPTGVGVLWAKRPLLEAIEPVTLGGHAGLHVDDAGSTLGDLPARLEAGTQPFEGVVGFAKAIAWMESRGREAIAAHERALGTLMRTLLGEVSGVRLLPGGDGPIASFDVAGVHAHDIASFLASRGVHLRAGHLCAQPLLRALGRGAVVRASLGAYSEEGDVAALVACLEEAVRWFA
jgi:cysteine desulfurase/selenocysteine lyase